MKAEIRHGHRLVRRVLRRLPDVVVGWALCAAATGAADVDPAHAPLAARDHHPFVVLYGIPSPEGVGSSSGDRGEWRLTLDVANHSIEERAGDETILLDGETYRTTLSVRVGLLTTWNLGLDLPYVHSREALLDGRIDDWHDLLGITTPNRDDFDVERLSFRYENGDGTLALSEATEGLGDIRASVARTWDRGASGQVALRVGVQLPSGSERRLSGLGTAGASLDVAAVRHFPLLERSAWAYGRLGLAATGGGGLLEDRRRRRVGYADLGVGWRIVPSLAFKLQLDAHQSVFRSALGPLGRDAFQISVGGTVRLSPATTLDLVVQENVRRDPVPDVSVQLGLRNRF